MNYSDSNEIKLPVEGVSAVERKPSWMGEIVRKFEKLLLFLAGLVIAALVVLSSVMFFALRETAFSKSQYQKELRIQEMQNSLSSSVIEADHNNYELSRQTVSDFFDTIEREVNLNEESDFSPQQIEVFRGILGRKAGINQLLEEKNPRAKAELGTLLETYRKTVREYKPLIKENE